MPGIDLSQGKEPNISRATNSRSAGLCPSQKTNIPCCCHSLTDFGRCCALVLNARRDLRFALRGPLFGSCHATTVRRFAMGSNGPRIRIIEYAVTAAALLLCPETSHADQGGGSFWFPGQFASLAAVQQTPGWALGVIYYHSSVAAAGSAAAAREILTGRIPTTVNVDLNLSLNGRADLVALTPSNTFATPVLGGSWPSACPASRQSRRQYRRSTDGDSRTNRGTRTGVQARFPPTGPRAERAAAMELWRQQLYGLRHGQYSRRRL